MYLISMPLITALIGWMTNKVAIVMLFRPRRPVKILWVTWQGVIPRRQADVAKRAADLIEQEILDRHLVRREIQRIDIEPFIEVFAQRIVFQSLGPKLRKYIFFRGVVADMALQQIHKTVVEMLRKEAPAMLERLSVEAERRLDFRNLVEERIAGFDLDKLEEVVSGVAASEFRSIEIMGGVLGFLVGLVQLGILMLSGALSL